ncbi:WW domain-containing oxidoreductase [Cyberlindnera fabianii]|uniref:WW domain-containing oxidoreductase n=1 Tax=Cyberlindnera fabianii TaxID=36022 RepID=A0A1V2KYJ7_CYBFA|nr:WW domain-containing oxidoreductase [Cyberlindnera fabianii]
MGKYNSEPLVDLSGKHILAVGGTGGLGRALAQELASHGAHVTVVGQTFRDADTKNVDFVKADLSSMKNTKEATQTLKHTVSDVDIVLLTTGIFAARKREETSEGLEKDMAVSFLNRLLLIDTVGPSLKKGTRVFVMGFPGNGQLGTIDDLNSEKSYQFIRTHMTTVAGNEALVIGSKGKYPGVHFFGLNPGLVKTNIRSNLAGEEFLEYIISWFNPTPEQFAVNVTPILVSPQLDDLDGVHFNRTGDLLDATKGMDEEYANNFLEKSRALISKALSSST